MRDTLEGDDPRDGPVLGYEFDYEEALGEHRLAEARGLESDFDEREVDAVDIRDVGDAVRFVWSEPEDADVVDAVVTGEADRLEVADRDDGELRAVLTDEARDRYLQSLRLPVVRSINARLDAAGFETAHALDVTDGIVVEFPDIDEDRLERAKDLLTDYRSLRFTFVDETATDAFFGEFEGELPDDFESCSIPGGYRTVLNRGYRDSRDELKEFFDDRGPEDHDLVWEFVQVDEDEARDERERQRQQEAARESALIDEDDLTDESAETCPPEQSHWRGHLVEPRSVLTGEDVLDASVGYDDEAFTSYTAMVFSDEGTELLAEATRENIGRILGLVTGERLHTAPIIQEPIDHGQMRLTLGTGPPLGDEYQDGEDLAKLIRAHSAPLEFELVRETSADERQ